MAVTPNSAVFPQTLNAGAPVRINTTSATTVFTGGANGSICTAINVSLSDASPRTLTLTRVQGGVTVVVLVTQIPASSGQLTAIPPVNIISRGILPGVPIDQDGNPAYRVPFGSVLQVAVAAITGNCDVDPEGWDY